MKEVGTLNAGTMLFKNVFMLAPETKQLFPKFRHLKDDLLLSNESFKNQAKLSISALSNAIMSFDDPPKLKRMLMDLGRIYESKGVSLATLSIVGNALMATIEAALGNDSCIETFNFFALFYNEGSNMLAEGYKD